MKRCQYIKEDGQRCAARPLSGSERCYFHDPAVRAERNDARKRGGISRSQAQQAPVSDVPPCSLNSAEEILKTLTETVNQVRRGEIDVKTANSIGCLAANAFRCLDRVDWERQQRRTAEKSSKPSQEHPWIREARREMEKKSGPLSPLGEQLLEHTVRVSENWGLDLPPTDPEELRRYDRDPSLPSFFERRKQLMPDAPQERENGSGIPEKS